MEIRDLDLKQFIESETGMRFNKANKINSPFNAADKTPSFSIYFDRNNNKWKFRRFLRMSYIRRISKLLL